MSEIIVTFKVNENVEDLPNDFTSETMKDWLMEIAEKNNLDLVSWGVI